MGFAETIGGVIGFGALGYATFVGVSILEVNKKVAAKEMDPLRFYPPQQKKATSNQPAAKGKRC